VEAAAVYTVEPAGVVTPGTPPGRAR
jgi:hypothetical protein